jgi:hypothetical protein
VSVFLSPETGTSSMDWVQLTRFYLNTETKSSFRNVVFKIKTRQWIMSRSTIFILTYYRYKLLDLICYVAPSDLGKREAFHAQLRSLFSYHKTQ